MTAIDAAAIRQQADQLNDQARFHKVESGRHRRRAAEALERRRVLLAKLEACGFETEIFGVDGGHHGLTTPGQTE